MTWYSIVATQWEICEATWDWLVTTPRRVTQTGFVRNTFCVPNEHTWSVEAAIAFVEAQEIAAELTGGSVRASRYWVGDYRETFTGRKIA